MLLTVKESAINVPQNIEARRRITFFANSLFMNMPKAPKVRDMLSFRLVIVIDNYIERKGKIECGLNNVKDKLINAPTTSCKSFLSLKHGQTH